MKILYIGNSKASTTSCQRAKALERLGHTVTILDPYQAMRDSLSSFSHILNFHTGYKFLQKKINSWLWSSESFLMAADIIWIDSGELFGKSAIQFVKSKNKFVILYNLDDPTGDRDKRRFKSLIKALPFYDLVVVVRKETEDDCRRLGLKNVLLVSRGYDEIAHKPFMSTDEIPGRFKSEVSFIGTWMRNEGRDAFILALINAGIKVNIWGNRWQKSTLWNELKPYYQGGALSGADYVAAIQGAKICLGMLSKGNRDLVTQRTFEIPYIGGLFCAERTAEHMTLYRDGVDAVFWDGQEECIRVCKRLLENPEEREKIRISGQQRVLQLNVGNEDICKKILLEANK